VEGVRYKQCDIKNVVNNMHSRSTITHKDGQPSKRNAGKHTVVLSSDLMSLFFLYFFFFFLSWAAGDSKAGGLCLVVVLA
jgi:hypothetical protein